jgi:hypothetical protein
MTIDIKDKQLNKILKQLRQLEFKEQQGGSISDSDIEKYKQLEEELKRIGYENIGNGYIGELE